MPNKRKFVILANERAGDHQLWIDACKNFSDKIAYRVVNLVSDNWYEQIIKEKVDCLLTKPGGLSMPFKQLYDERLMILAREKHFPMFPCLDEVLIYENKRFFSYWLKANNLPHPKTHVFYDRKETEKFLSETAFPVVAKLNIGASGNGVQILKNKDAADRYIHEIFTSGKTSRVGPRLDKGHIIKRVAAKLLDPKSLIERLRVYKTVSGDVQKGFCIFQEFIKHDYEWRVVRIGDSFFAHKKLLKKDKASGSLEKKYDNPPLKLLEFVKEITERFQFFSQAVDIFETSEGHYLINEMQCIFGQSDPYQMLVDGTPGRYLFADGQWVFEAGDFNTHESFDLRLQAAIDLYGK
jgi:glutathione synthase/RimK-type ligase-like ATP-grasp enzyme